MASPEVEAALANLRAEVERDNTVNGSAKTLIESLATQLEANKLDPAAIQGIADTLRANSDNLAAAVQANTPQEPPPAPPA